MWLKTSKLSCLPPQCVNWSDYATMMERSFPQMVYLQHLNLPLDKSPSKAFAPTLACCTQLLHLGLGKLTTANDFLPAMGALTQLQSLSFRSSKLPTAFYHLKWPNLHSLSLGDIKSDALPTFGSFLDQHPHLTRLEAAFGVRSPIDVLRSWKMMMMKCPLVAHLTRIDLKTFDVKPHFVLDVSQLPHLRRIEWEHVSPADFLLPVGHTLTHFPPLTSDGNNIRRHQSLLDLLRLGHQT